LPESTNPLNPKDIERSFVPLIPPDGDFLAGPPSIPVELEAQVPIPKSLHKVQKSGSGAFAPPHNLE
jgi:hypothetical protein